MANGSGGGKSRGTITRMVTTRTTHFTTLPTKKILAELAVEPTQGLSGNEATKRLAQQGPNTLGHERVYWHVILLRQFASPFIYLLVAAAALAIALGEIMDGLMIVLFLTINTVLGFYQEYRSEKTIELLKKYITPTATVVRDGQRQKIASTELVTGDIIYLQTGDRIPADVRFIDAPHIGIDESILTGESVAVRKTDEPLSPAPQELYQSLNLGFSGTTVIDGKATVVVIATGQQTALGDIARLTGEVRHTSDFEKGISRLSTFILKLVLLTLTGLFLANLIIKGEHAEVFDLLLFSITLAISVIPEALPVVTTFSLSSGALRLAKHHVVVKRLSAIEDLGGIDVLCTDKTGTLTENALTVDAVAPDSSPLTIIYAAAASSSLGHQHEPFDIAVWQRLSHAERTEVEKIERLDDIPFNPAVRCNGVSVAIKNRHLLIVRGAAEVILAGCSQLKTDQRLKLEKWITVQGQQGRRILAVATRAMPKTNQPTGTIGPELLANHLTFIGAISFIDPIKQSAAEAVKQARALGVTIKIVTGDSREIAGAVAHHLGLIASADHVLTGAELLATPPDQRHEVIEKTIAFARISPEQKYEIIKTLQEKHTVGFLGEGINDAPALKVAGVSLVVASGADIAKEAGDIVMLEKDLKSIIDGIKIGREVFSNTTKYIRATLTSNFGNFYAVAVASLLIPFLPILPAQILLINLLSDFPMLAIATDTTDPAEIATPQRYNIRSIAAIATILGVVSTIFDFIFFALFARISPGVLQTNWFIGSILTELIFLFSIRTKLPFWRAQAPSITVIGLTGTAALATIIIPYTLFGQQVFHFVRPSAWSMGIIFSIVILYFITTELVKQFYYTFTSTSSASAAGAHKQ